MQLGETKTISAEARFFAKVQKTETCWLWTGSICSSGYGMFRVVGGQNSITAHQFLAGKAPAGMVWHHTCRVKHCVNPDHLEAITRRERSRRGNRTGAKPTAADIRFWNKVEKTETCWIWTGAKDTKGYGAFRDSDGRTVRAHRFSAGEPPRGLVWDHLCRVRNCVNPDHLEAVTQGENVRRGMRHQLPRV